MSTTPPTYGDWDKWMDVMDSKAFQARMARIMPQTMNRIGVMLVGAMRRSIRSGDYAPNSALTKAMKGSSKPLVDRGDLMRALTYDAYGRGTGKGKAGGYGLYVGLRRRSPKANIGAALHEGFTLTVTPKMRAAVFAQLAERNPRARFNSTGPAKSIWIVPPRPFIEQPFKASAPQIQRALEGAIYAALTGKQLKR